MGLLPLLTAFGLGSVVTAFIQAWLAQKSTYGERSFREKRTAYVGLLEAYLRAAVEGTDKAGRHFAYWEMRCDLVAPQSVREPIRRMAETSNDSVGRKKAEFDMRAAMRADLGITK